MGRTHRCLVFMFNFREREARKQPSTTRACADVARACHLLSFAKVLKISEMLLYGPQTAGTRAILPRLYNVSGPKEAVFYALSSVVA